ncbi:MAG: nucleoside-diphosphate kinase [Parcubacteria group bacterium Greene0416_14]|nr:MAG: nucleoside-diphosphate kinase [Parcubacteria group bacterium Greene0416_14]TSD00567.1 MAG: nucleoside-diphosphate kinase [Parcubacteria group bacterium Greene1014_15]TSD08260.1 MAG: nucleoside-diphosphate kinase [Parcubacteria group bacterium Greene0714_4]
MTLVLLKPDAVKRGIVGDIIGRFERALIHIVGMRMIMATPVQISRHFANTTESITALGEKMLRSYASMDIDPQTLHRKTDARSIGLDLQCSITEYFQSGPMIKMVLCGTDAMARVREMVGSTLPYEAVPGTIRGDFSLGKAIENIPGKACVNMVHASENTIEACREIASWFDRDEIMLFSYSRSSLPHMHDAMPSRLR